MPVATKQINIITNKQNHTTTTLSLLFGKKENKWITKGPPVCYTRQYFIYLTLLFLLFIIYIIRLVRRNASMYHCFIKCYFILLCFLLYFNVLFREVVLDTSTKYVCLDVIWLDEKWQERLSCHLVCVCAKVIHDTQRRSKQEKEKNCMFRIASVSIHTWLFRIQW